MCSRFKGLQVRVEFGFIFYLQSENFKSRLFGKLFLYSFPLEGNIYSCYAFIWKNMVLYSNPYKMRLMVLPHRMNTRLSHGYSMLGVATKERNIPYLDNICFFGGGGEDGANTGDFISERVCSQ